MAKHICGHCAREFDAVGDQKKDCCPGCRELGHKGHSQKCPACKADQPAVQNAKPPPIPRGPTKTIEIPPCAQGPAAKEQLLSTLAGLQTIAHTPYGQKAAEDLILAYLGDAEIAAAFAPFARKPI